MVVCCLCQFVLQAFVLSATERRWKWREIRFVRSVSRRFSIQKNPVESGTILHDNQTDQSNPVPYYCTSWYYFYVLLPSDTNRSFTIIKAP
jgi:hypothetical protein